MSWITEWYLCTSMSEVLYWSLKLTVWMGPNDAWWIQSEISGMYPLIHWCVPYAHASSKVTVLLCSNGYQLCTWWCVKWLLSFKASLSHCVGCSNWSKPKSYNRPYVLIMFPRFWSCPMICMQELLLTVICCFCQLSVCVGSHSYMQVMIFTRSYYRLSSLVMSHL